jgi:hypothetical protein
MTMSKYLLVGAVIALAPAALSAQAQSRPALEKARVASAPLKTHQKKRLKHPGAAERGLTPDKLVAVTKPDGKVVIERRAKPTTH